MKSIKHISLAVCATVILGLGSCAEDFLEQPAIGALSDDVIANQAGLEKLLIGAYAALMGSALAAEVPGRKPLIIGFTAV